MKIFFIGGTGNISTYCVELALDQGYDITLLNRGKTEVEFSRPVKTIIGDRHDRFRLAEIASEGKYDVVADFIGFTPAEAEDDVAAFAGKAGQFIYISSVAAYQKPPRHYLHTESTPLHNPFWQYAKDKILSEEIFNRAYREQSFPVTIVRPWHTYGQTRVPTATMGGGYTSVHRVRNGLPVVVQGDGQSLWGLTWSGDLAAGIVGLFGQEKALGEAFHICTEEILTWDQIYRIMAKAAGASSVELVHLPSEIIHSHYPDIGTPLIGDLSYSAVYDLSKIRRIIPDYRAKVTWTEGVSRSIAWFDDDPKRREVDEALNKKIDNLVEVARKARG